MSRDLQALFAPSSVAILGASADPAKWGNVLARGALAGAHRRSVFLVNRSGGEILGQRALCSLEDVPEPPELVVVSVPASGFEAAVDDSLAAGARAIVVVSAGLGETGAEGQARERAVVERVRAARAMMLGPNCLGVFDAAQELDLGWSELPPGSIGLVSQSGNLALELGRLATDAGLGFSRFASIGNQADLVAADLVDALVAHAETRLVALYLEDFRDGRAFVAAAARARAAGKSVLLLTGGVTGASARAALSHTGALVSDARAVEAACRAAGIVAVTTPARLIDAALALLPARPVAGPRIAVFGDGGGHGVVAVDVLAARGLEVEPLSEQLRGRLGELLPPQAILTNPVDLVGGGERDLANYARVGDELLGADEVDAVLLTGYFGGYSIDSPTLADDEARAASLLADAAARAGKALVVHTMYPGAPIATVLRSSAVPTYGDIERAADALALLHRQRHTGPAERPGHERVLSKLPRPVAGYSGARALLQAAGVEVVEARETRTLDEVLAGAAGLGYPVVLKAVDLLHKSDSGGVALGLDDPASLTRAFTAIRARYPDSTLSVERLAPVGDGVELIAGAIRDPRFGPIALVGIGGIYADILRDTAVALAPLEEDAAEALIRSLRGAPLLTGARGQAKLDLAAAARAVAAISGVAAACDDIEQIEANPLLVTPAGALALDARIVLRGIESPT